MAQPNFAMMWANFPDHKKYPTLRALHTSIGGQLAVNITARGFGPNGNTCAVRLSRAMNYGNMPIRANLAQRLGVATLTGADGHAYIYRVRELGAYLNAAIGVTPKRITKQFSNAFVDQRGLVLFEVEGWGSAGGHAALWDGKHFREAEHDDYRAQRDNPVTPGNEGTTIGMILWPL